MKGLYGELCKLYQVQKTLKFELIPQGKTMENIEKNGILDVDKKKAEAYKRVKRYCDEYHKKFIEKCLSNLKLSGLDEYYRLRKIQQRNDNEEKELNVLIADLRKQIAKKFTNDVEYNGIFKSDMIDTYLTVMYSEDTEKINDINEFKKFTTYFSGYNTNRENMYSAEERSTAISYRIINENLPIFVDNMKIYKHISEKMKDVWSKVVTDLNEYMEVQNIDDVFSIEYFNNVLTQKGISDYNTLISGKSKEDGKKVKGLNEYINEFKGEKLPKFQELYKQILSDKIYSSFKIENITDDKELIENIEEYCEKLFPLIDKIANYVSDFSCDDKEYIYINNDESLSKISNDVFDDWSKIKKCISFCYDKDYAGKKKTGTEIYDEEKNKYLKKQKCYSLKYIEQCCESDEVSQYISSYIVKNELVEKIKEGYFNYENIKFDEKDPKRLIKSENEIAIIKNLLDSIKRLQEFLFIIVPKDKNLNKAEKYYSNIIPCYNYLNEIIPLYNKARNYLTQKPYSLEKIKLNFGCSTLLNGWDVNKEEENLGIILEKENKYYLGIINSRQKNLFKESLNSDLFNESNYRKMEYKLLPGPNKMLPKVFFSRAKIAYFAPSDELLKKYKNGLHKKGEKFDIDFCHELIDFYKNSLQKHEEWKNFGFVFKETDEYNDIGEFYRDVEKQGYKIEYSEYSQKYIDKLIEDGKLYLFQIYNKDFSEYSKGIPNLHTMYWKALFDLENLKSPIYKLNGNAEVFFRKKSLNLSDTAIHLANHKVGNKDVETCENCKTSNIFDYDLVKDKRFTLDKFQFHVPITMNFGCLQPVNCNEIINEYLRKNEDVYVIGIDRGERNLLYVSVIDKNEKIIYQRSLNQIINKYNEKTFTVDYHKKLDLREEDRKKARVDWKCIDSIKELKEGYMSQVIHEILELMRKYNAIIVIEDLNKGFKNSRIKVEKQVYQKFEKMLINKLNYVVFKDAKATEGGGIYNAYQLTNKFESFNKLGKQTGVLYYIPAWCTSKIDPITGFIDRIHIKYENFEKSIEFVKKLDDIRYNEKEKYFEFDIDYSKYTERLKETINKWTLCSYGERIYTSKNSGGKFDSIKIDLSHEFMNLLEKYNIDLFDIKNEILTKADVEFFKGKDKKFGFIQLFRLMMQMRNSVSNDKEDYLISPIKNSNGYFFNTKDENEELPIDADANGAYNIARKGLMLVKQMRAMPEGEKTKYNITEAEWLNYVQQRGILWKK